MATRNVHAPASSYCDAILDLSAGSGVNVVNRARSQFRLAANAVVSIDGDGSTPPTWGSGSDGAYIDFAVANTRGWVYDNSGGGAAKTLTEGAGAMRFSMSALQTTTDRPLFQTGDATGLNGAFWASRLALSNTIELTARVSSTNHTLRFANVGFAKPVNLVWVWGLFGFNAWLHYWDTAALKWTIAEAAVGAGNPKLLVAPMTVPAGDKWWLGFDPGTANHGDFKLYAYSTWMRNIAKVTVDGPQRNWYIDDLLVDPDLMLAEIPSYTNALWNNTLPMVGRVTRDSATFETAAAESLSGSIYVDVQLSRELAGLAHTSSAGAVSASSPFASLELTVSGLASQFGAGEVVYRRNRWSTDGVTWKPFPGGVGKFRMQRTAGEYDVLNISDTHTTNAGDGGAPLANLGGGLDVVLADDGTLRTDTGTGRRKLWAAWCTIEDALLNTDPDFTIIGHDFAMTDTASPAGGVSDKQAVMFDAWARAINMFSPVWKLGPAFVGLGNHDGDDANNQSRGGNAIQKGSTIARKSLVPNPRHDTYPEGGENWPRSEWLDPANDDADFANDAEGINASPLENAFGFHWSGGACRTLWVFGDSGRYNTVDAVSWPYVPSLEAGTLGTSQEAWMRGLLLGSNAKYKIVDVHSLPGGGFAGQTTGQNLYKRGNVTLLGNSDYYAEFSAVEPECQKRFTDMLMQSGAILSGHHDHRAFVGLRNGIAGVVANTGGAPSHFGSGADPGWSSFTELARMYGTPQSLGTVDASDNDLTAGGAIAQYNVAGYTLFEVREDGVYWRVRETIEATEASPNSETDIAKYSRPKLSVSRYFSGDYAKDGSHQISLVDALNPTPVPRMVAAVFDASVVELADQWWTDDYGDFSERNAGVVGSYKFDERYGAAGIVQLTSSAAAAVHCKWAPRWVARHKLESVATIHDDPLESGGSRRRQHALRMARYFGRR